MQLVRRLRIPAFCCALAVLLCELIARPYASMGISDDGPYILTARMLANTGHIAYNGWATAILGWQLYLGAAFIKLFGFSYNTVRVSTLFIAALTAFLLQRTLVRTGITERNATIGTLALALSPLYLMLSATYMSDIFGLFAIVVCLYGCLRALQSPTDRSTILWLCFAVATNAIFGTARQIAWLGLLVVVPSTLWLLRSRRRVLAPGAMVAFAGVLFTLGCMQWFARQPYSIPEHLLVHRFPIRHSLTEFLHAFLETPFLLLPVWVLFLAEIPRSSRRVASLISLIALAYILLALHVGRVHSGALLEPTQGDWVNAIGTYSNIYLQGSPPVFLNAWVRILLTVLSIGGLLGLLASFFRPPHTSPGTPPSIGPSLDLSWIQLGTLLAPFLIIYFVVLIPRSGVQILDRYQLVPLVIELIFLVRYYQQRIQLRLPAIGLLFVAAMAVYGTVVTHNMFAFYRARAALAAEIRAAGVPDTSVDNGWEYNFGVELQHANYLNDPRIVTPARAYVPGARLLLRGCRAAGDETPHIHPIYSVSFAPDACYGPAPFAPVHYSRWPYRAPGTLYVVRIAAPATP